MKFFEFIFISVLCVFIIMFSIWFGGFLENIRANQEISYSSTLYKDIIEIKRNCSEDVSYIIREVLADDKLTYREYNYIKSEYKKENDKKILEELKK